MRRPTNRRIANVVAGVAFAVTLFVLAVTGFAVALLDQGGGGRSPLLAIVVLIGVSALVALAARLLAILILRLARPDV